jgi:hypothetical protein
MEGSSAQILEDHLEANANLIQNLRNRHGLGFGRSLRPVLPSPHSCKAQNFLCDMIL